MACRVVNVLSVSQRMLEVPSEMALIQPLDGRLRLAVVYSLSWRRMAHAIYQAVQFVL